MSVEAIAARAGVGKATIYRWWPNKACRRHGRLPCRNRPPLPFPETGSARADLTSQIGSVIDLFNDPAIDALYGALYYRLLVSGEPLTRRYAQTLVEQLYPALAMRPSP